MSFWGTLGGIASLGLPIGQLASSTVGLVAGMGGLDIAGGLISDNQERIAAEKDRQMQLDFAKNGIRWKVADAQAAGLHPLAALGASTPSFSPVGGAGTHTGEGVSRMGQDISRAVQAGLTRNERNEELGSLQIENAKLQNKYIEEQINSSKASRMRSPGTGPALPHAGDFHVVDGQGDSNSALVTKPDEVVASSKNARAQSPGVITSYSFQRTRDGGLAPVMSSDTQQRLEDDVFGKTDWYIRNRVLPWHEGVGRPDIAPPAGTYWKWDSGRQAYYPEKDSEMSRYIRKRKQELKERGY